MKTKDLIEMYASQIGMHAHDQQVRIEQLEAENKRLNLFVNRAGHLTIALEQLAEREATIATLREALFFAVSGATEVGHPDYCECLMCSALSLPAPTEHLSQYRDAVIEECEQWARLVAREMDDTNGTATYIANGIRAMKEKK